MAASSIGLPPKKVPNPYALKVAMYQREAIFQGGGHPPTLHGARSGSMSATIGQ